MLNELQNHEIAKNVRSIATERKINVAQVFEILESAISVALVCVYGKAKMLVKIDHDSGAIAIYELRKVFSDEKSEKMLSVLDEVKGVERGYHSDNENDNVQFHLRTIGLTEAKKLEESAKIGDILNIQIPNAWASISKTRKFLKAFKDRFINALNALIRKQEYLHFKKKEGTLIIAVVRRYTSDGYILSHDNYDILLPCKIDEKGSESHVKMNSGTNKIYNEVIPGEKFSPGSSISVYIKSVSNTPRLRYQVIASRTHPLFLEELLKQTIPEIRNEQIFIKKIVRIPGVRAKVIVHSLDKNIDPIGACIGIRGIRIQSISKELYNEKIDIVEYSEDHTILIKNSIKPITLVNIVFDNNKNTMNIIVPDSDVSSAIGKKGINVKLLSSMMNCNIMIVGENEFSKKKKEEFGKCVVEIKNGLDVDEIIAQLLVVANYNSIEKIAQTSIQELSKIEHFDEELVMELKNRSELHISSLKKMILQNIDKDYIEFVDSFDKELIYVLVNSSIRTIKDLADLDIEELSEIIEGYEEILIDEIELTNMLVKAKKIVNELE